MSDRPSYSYYGSIPSSGSGTAGSSNTGPTVSGESNATVPDNVLNSIRTRYWGNPLNPDSQLPEIANAIEICNKLCQNPWCNESKQCNW